MDYEEVLGSDAYIRDLVKAITTLSQSNDQFLVIPPGGGEQRRSSLNIRA